MTHACSECGGSGLQAAGDGGLRGAVQRMAGALMFGEWAEQASADIDAATLESQISKLVSTNQAMHCLLNAPELFDFRDAVVREAAHQRVRYGAAHDQGKTSADWFWLVAHLASKAMTSIKEAECIAQMMPAEGGNARTVLEASLRRHRERSIHHIVTTAAALANWHAALIDADHTMRPGISTPREASHVG